MAQDRTEQFVQLLTSHQTAVYAYILSLLPEPAQAEDVLQETNLTCWRKSDEFLADADVQGRDFVAWACRIAYFKVLSHRRRQARDRHVFDDGVIDYLAERMAERGGDMDRRAAALKVCIGHLKPQSRDILTSRYHAGGSVQRLAQQLGRSVGSISQTLYRLRTALLACIEQTLAREDQS